MTPFQQLDAIMIRELAIWTAVEESLTSELAALVNHND
jgi:hypothetical protein